MEIGKILLDYNTQGFRYRKMAIALNEDGKENSAGKALVGETSAPVVRSVQGARAKLLQEMKAIPPAIALGQEAQSMFPQRSPGFS